ncbi:hypothetical protein BIW11_13477 [Tropilaelaps mercedesae]|uniref:WW domain-containing protein n=1 Tax=Tropilaelaps mercedesae TaxID=418985 RepID=A0A1V9X1M6_9ACAR|nr:hypothetical protein BIW11_13477 [Tropilaelaps mercedesae]
MFAFRISEVPSSKLDYSRQDSLERRASSLESPKSSQEGDHSKGSKETVEDDTPPEPLERDYPQPQAHQQPHHSQPQPPPRGAFRQQQTAPMLAQPDNSSSSSSSNPGTAAESAERVSTTTTAGVRHSRSSPPNSLFAQASLEVHPADDNDVDVDSSPSPGYAPGSGSSGGGPFERRFRLSLDEALRQRREKMGEVIDDDSEPRSDEDSLIEHQQTGSDLDEGDEGEMVSNSPTGFHYSIASSKPSNTSNPLQLPPRTGLVQRGHSAPLRPRSEGHHPQPIYANVQQSQGGGSVVVVHGHHKPTEDNRPIHTEFLEGGQLSAPLDLALATTPPFPSPNEDPVRYLSDHWGEYRSTGGRPYYYNYVTGEHSWKPPRTRRKFSSQRLTQSVDSVDGLETLDGPDGTDTGLDSSVEGIMPSPPPSPTETIASGWSKLTDVTATLKSRDVRHFVVLVSSQARLAQIRLC